MEKSDGMGGTETPQNNQKPQCPEDKHGPGYDNDTPAGWLRGPDATKKPGFDHSKGKR